MVIVAVNRPDRRRAAGWGRLSRSHPPPRRDTHHTLEETARSPVVIASPQSARRAQAEEKFREKRNVRKRRGKRSR